MTTLVTGGAGFIGSHVVAELVAAGEKVVVIDNLSTGTRSALSPGIELFVCDCGDQDAVRAVIAGHGVTDIIHLAGSAVVPDSMNDPARCYRNNTAVTRNLIEVALECGVTRFVLASTAAVYGDAGAAPISEATPPQPISPYGKSMLMSEMMLQDVAATQGLRYIILRVFNAAGADPARRGGLGEAHASSLVRQAVEVALGIRPMINIFSTQLATHDGTAVRDYVHVGDVARAHAIALGHLRTGGGSTTLNCGSGLGRSVLDVVVAAERACGRPLPVRYLAPRTGDPVALVADIRRLGEELGWAPRFQDLDTIISHALAPAYRRLDQRDGTHALLKLVAESGVPASQLRKLLPGLDAARARQTIPQEAADAPLSLPSAPDDRPPAKAKKLTIGMATYDDYDGVYFTLQAIRLYHPEILDDVEFVVVDNNPTGPCGPALKQLEGMIADYRYIARGDVSGTAIRDWVFREARGKYVLCIDCHILIEAGALKRLLDIFDADPATSDLLQGPLVYDDLKGYATHFRPEWEAGMYGTWGSDPAGAHPDLPAFDIPMQGLGLFACRRDAWPGFNPAFRGFGGEEGYIHEKFRQRGGRVLCLPFLRWMHRFNRPLGTSYQNRWTDRVRNYLIGFREVGWDTKPVIDHFREFLGDRVWTAVAERLEPELLSADADGQREPEGAVRG